MQICKADRATPGVAPRYALTPNHRESKQMTTATAIAWATLDYNPKEAPSTVNGVEYTTQVTIDGAKHRIYYKIGGLCDYLRQGDTAMVETVKGKWKLGKNQTPELLATLQQRKAISTPQRPPMHRQGRRRRPAPQTTTTSSKWARSRKN